MRKSINKEQVEKLPLCRIPNAMIKKIGGKIGSLLAPANLISIRKIARMYRKQASKGKGKRMHK